MNRNLRSGPACPAFEDLKGYVDRELIPDRCEAVETHVRTCAACAEEVRIMERIGEGLGTLAAAEAPPAQLRERILEKVGSAPTRPRAPRINWLWLVGGTAASAMAVAILLPVFTPAREAARKASSASRLNQMQPGQDYDETAAGGARAARPQMAYGGAPGPSAAAPASPAMAPEVNTYKDTTTQPRRNGGPGYAPGEPPAAGVTENKTDNDINRYVRGTEGDVTSRKVVQTADFSITVHRVLEDAEKDFTKRIQADGGYIESSVLTSGENGDRTAVLAMRVPVERWEATINWLNGFGDVTAKNVRGEDITGRWIDERAQVRELRAEEDRLAKKVDAAKTAAERSSARWELVQLRGHIRASEERFAATAKMAALATLNVSLTQTRKSAQGAGFLGDMSDTLGAALGGFMTAVRIPLAGLIWLLVFSPLWLPCLLIFRWVSRARAETS